MIASLVISTIAYFVAAHYLKRYMDEIDIPKGMVRSLSVFVIAAAVSYGVAWLADLVVH